MTTSIMWSIISYFLKSMALRSSGIYVCSTIFPQDNTMKTLKTLPLLIIKFLITVPIFITNTGQMYVRERLNM